MNATKYLDQIDPLPEFEGGYVVWDSVGFTTTTAPSKRQLAELYAHDEKWAGNDWRDIKGKPHLHINGKQQMKYCPPEPAIPWTYAALRGEAIFQQPASIKVDLASTKTTIIDSKDVAYTPKNMQADLLFDFAKQFATDYSSLATGVAYESCAQCVERLKNEAIRRQMDSMRLASLPRISVGTGLGVPISYVIRA